jgi:predicted glycosyltransferase
MYRKIDIVFMATSRSGLGHIRRSATIARAVKRLNGRMKIGLFTNAPIEGLAAEDMAAFDDTALAERSHMVEAAVALGASTFVSDTMVPDHIENAKGSRILVLRETPAERLSHFKLSTPKAWDLVIVPNPCSHWMPDPDGDWAKHIEAVGWIYRRPAVFSLVPHNQPQLLVAMGGGGTHETANQLARQTEVLIDIARRLTSRRFSVVQALGPRAPASARISNADLMIDPGSDLNDYFARADVVLSTAGYNSVLELAITTTPTMLMSIARTYDDQAERAALWGQKLGATYNSTDFQASAAWLAKTLECRTRREAIDIGPSGDDVAAREILALAT